ncbi:MAG: GTP cyclohydrolase I FolE2 [Magnetococcales bacterium]|nr:GTP cyclohydrolase I FolE2 [Magnetococcales bacterium]MBF0582985.1 GTP cyclohydrolase I FolE2 [Magnetococcales bacterium]
MCKSSPPNPRSNWWRSGSKSLWRWGWFWRVKNLAQHDTKPLQDVQAQKDSRRLSIDKVGVKDIRYPILVRDRDRGQQHTIASVNMYVKLPHQFKGTHMSRFLEVLAEQNETISVENVPDILRKIQACLNAEEAYIELEFPYFIRKEAPVSKASALMDYQVRFSGVCVGKSYQLTLGVRVPVTSLCPCSKEISQYGAHNQRSHVTVTLRYKKFIWVEEIIELVEKHASCELYAILKRPDEKYVTEKAYENPRFVEDIVRSVAADLEKDPRITLFTVESENFESIHNHSAYAFISGGD